MIDQVIKLDKQKQGLGGIVDPKRIGASGHSLGGITTYGLAYSGCCTDKRIKAAIPMSGIIGVVDGPEGYFQGAATPLLAVHGNADGTVPYGADMNGFARAKTPKYFLTFLGAGHVTPFLGGDNPSAMALKQSTIDFFNRYLKDDKAALDRAAHGRQRPGCVLARGASRGHGDGPHAPTSTTKKVDHTEQLTSVSLDALGRSDAPLCEPDSPVQLHALWHVLTAFVLWVYGTAALGRA